MKLSISLKSLAFPVLTSQGGKKILCAEQTFVNHFVEVGSGVSITATQTVYNSILNIPGSKTHVLASQTLWKSSDSPGPGLADLGALISPPPCLPVTLLH